MATDKLFSVAGTARNADGTVKVRFANDLVSRIKILNNAGCTDINLVELPKGMTKLEAVQYLQNRGDFSNGDAGFAVQTKLAEKTRVAKKGELKVAATSAKVSAKTKTSAKQDVTASN